MSGQSGAGWLTMHTRSLNYVQRAVQWLATHRSLACAEIDPRARLSAFKNPRSQGFVLWLGTADLLERTS